MAFAVESYSTGTSTNFSSVTVTKPSGVQVGDLLLAVVNNSFPNSVTCSGFATAYDGYYDADPGITDVRLRVLYKIADASDVSASTYTFVGSSFIGIATMMRISGWGIGNPIYTSADSWFSTPSSARQTETVTGLALDRLSSQLAIIVAGGADSDEGESYSNFGSPTMVSGVSNPTWTEVVNLYQRASNGLTGVSLYIAFANTSNTSNVTGYSFEYDYDGNDDEVGGLGALLLLNQPVDATGNSSFLAVDPVLFAQSGAVISVLTNDFIAVDPVLFSQSVKTKNLSRVNNVPKPDISDVDNLPK